MLNVVTPSVLDFFCQRTENARDGCVEEPKNLMCILAWWFAANVINKERNGMHVLAIKIHILVVKGKQRVCFVNNQTSICAVETVSSVKGANTHVMPGAQSGFWTEDP